MEGTSVALFGKYLLTVEHVVSLEKPTVATPVGRVTLAATKIAQRTFLEHRGRCYPLERLVADKYIDVALFRLLEQRCGASWRWRCIFPPDAAAQRMRVVATRLSHASVEANLKPPRVLRAGGAFRIT